MAMLLLGSNYNPNTGLTVTTASITVAVAPHHQGVGLVGNGTAVCLGFIATHK
uniref:Uncharacterized protein n=1 Tax=Oryza brachyantha TaxID=4533 RepID=J3MVC3_ORYBR